MSGKSFLIMAGGTGGHVYPALSFAQLARAQGHRISWLGTGKGLEARLVPENNIEFHKIDIAGVRGRGITSLMAAPVKIINAILQARKVLKRVSPDLVIGFGGYSAGPGGVASKIAGIPLVIHEQNAIAGTTNKLLSRIASKVLCAFDGALPNAVILGNPVRAEILALSTHQKDYRQPLNLLVVGGSLGARFLNQTLPLVLASMDLPERPAVRHQAGPKLLDQAKQSYADAGVHAEVSAYIEDMAAAYQWADLVVCRAGAMTVSELAVAGVPALLVPFPFAIDDHQTANAQWLVDVGGAEIYQQSENNMAAFTAGLSALLKSPSTLAAMAAKARDRGVRNSSEQILSICENLAKAGVTHVA